MMDSTEHRSVAEILANCRDMIDPAMHAAVDTLPSSMRHIAGYHLGWWDESRRATPSGGGKALRPALTLLCAESIGGDAAHAIPGAVAVELVHNFSLLHDDVMDGDVTRRHRATAWKMFGTAPAILAGDSLVTLAFDVLASSGHHAARDAAKTLSLAIQELIAGQYSDVAFEDRDDVDLSECLNMAAQKTGALLGAACALGAAFAGADRRQVELMRDFGEQLGLAFQLVDDLLGIWGKPESTGKPAYSDLFRRKKSLPVVAALTSQTPAGEQLAALYRSADGLSHDDVARAAELADHAGGRAWSHRLADDLLDRAARQLRRAVDSPRAVAELTSLAHLLTRRDH